MYREIRERRRFIGKFQFGDDLLSAITEFCKKHSIRMGVFWVIGAVKNASIGYYKQDVKEYAESVRLNEKLEITSCLGNISIKDNEIFAHAHITLSNHEGKVFGGHLTNGTEIFAAEFYIEELVAENLVTEDLVRKEDSQTGLSLWPGEIR